MIPERDRPASEEIFGGIVLTGERLKRLQDARDNLSHVFNRGHYFLSREGTPIGEAYLSGEVAVYLAWVADPSDRGHGSAATITWVMVRRRLEKTIIEDTPICGGHRFYGYPGDCWDKGSVLVSNIEIVNAIEVGASIGLYGAEKQVNDLRRGAGADFLYSFNSCFKGGFVVSEGEKGVAIDAVFVGTDQDAECMIQGRSEIVDNITDDGRGMFAEATADLLHNVSRLKIDVSADTIRVSGLISKELPFKLLDVAVGSLNL